MMMTMMSCLSVCNVGILWTNGRLFSYCSAELLFIDPGVHVGQFLPASASRGTKQRRQLHFQFALLVYEFTTSVRL